MTLQIYLIPVVMRVFQFKASWDLANAENLVNEGEYPDPIEMRLDPLQLRPGSPASSDWRPKEVLEACILEPQKIHVFDTWEMGVGNALRLPGTEGLMFYVFFELKGYEEQFISLCLASQFFDSSLQWKSAQSQARILGLLAKAMRAKPPDVNAPDPADFQRIIALNVAMQDARRGSKPWRPGLPPAPTPNPRPPLSGAAGARLPSDDKDD